MARPVSWERPRSFLMAANTPMCQWTAAERRWATGVAVLLGTVYAVAFGAVMGDFFRQSDLIWYAAMASGHMRGVMQPFALRQLGPLVVRGLGAAFHLSLQQAFVVEGTLALLVSLLTVCALAVRTSAPRWLLLAIVAMPFWPELFFGLALPDLWYAGVLSVFLLLLHRERLLPAACMMFPLMLSRESTSLTLVCFLLSAWKRLRWREGLLAVAATAAGSRLAAYLAAGSVGNNEHLPQFFYLAAKVPWNILQNLFGIRTWTNVNTACGAPVWQHTLHLGVVQAVGYCSVSYAAPLLVAQALLTTFGLLPLLAGMLWWRSRRVPSTNLQANDVLLRFCLLYGAVCFVLAPLIGVWFYRLFGYAWPLFAVAIPLLFGRLPKLTPRGRRSAAGVAFCVLHVACCAVEFRQQLLPVVALEAGLWLAGFFVLRVFFEGSQRASGSPKAAPIAEARAASTW